MESFINTGHHGVCLPFQGGSPDHDHLLRLPSFIDPGPNNGEEDAIPFFIDFRFLRKREIYDRQQRRLNRALMVVMSSYLLHRHGQM